MITQQAAGPDFDKLRSTIEKYSDRLTLFEQAGTSLNLFADRNVDLSITPHAFQFLGMTVGTPAQLAAAGLTPSGLWIDATITAAQTQSFNAGFILIFAPIMAALWAFLAKRKPDFTPFR